MVDLEDDSEYANAERKRRVERHKAREATEELERRQAEERSGLREQEKEDIKKRRESQREEETQRRASVHEEHESQTPEWEKGSGEENLRVHQFFKQVDRLYLSRSDCQQLWSNTRWQKEAQRKVEGIFGYDKLSEKGPEYRQTTLTGEAATTLPEIFETAVKVKPKFDSIIKHLGELSGVQPELIILPAIKTKERAVEKSLEYEERFILEKEKEAALRAASPQKKKDEKKNLRIPHPASAAARSDSPKKSAVPVERGPGVSWVLDIVRGSLVAKTAEQVIDIVETLLGQEANQLSKREHKDWEVVRIKNRFQVAHLHGYRDFLISLRIRAGDAWHICELQVHVMSLWQYNVVNQSHQLYMFLKPYFGPTAHEPSDTKKKLTELMGLRDMWNHFKMVSGQDGEASDMVNTVVSWVQQRGIRTAAGKPTMKHLSECTALTGLTGVTRAQVMLYQEWLRQIEEEQKCRTNLPYAKVLHSKAKDLMRYGYLHAAEVEIREALFLSKQCGEEHRSEAGLMQSYILGSLSAVLLKKQEYVHAGELLNEVSAVQEAFLPPGHPQLGITGRMLATYLKTQGEHDQAIPMLNTTLRLLEKVLGEDHTEVLNAVQCLADAYVQVSQPHKAIPLQKRLLESFINTYGDIYHPGRACLLVEIGRLYLMCEELHTAKDFLERALDMRLSVFGCDHLQVAKVLKEIAGVMTKMENFDGAVPMLERALEMEGKIVGNTHIIFANTKVFLADCHQATGGFEIAKTMYQSSIHIIKREMGEESVELAEVYGKLAQVCRMEGNTQEASDLLEKVVVILTNALGDVDPKVGDAFFAQSELMFAMGNVNEGAKYMHKADKIRNWLKECEAVFDDKEKYSRSYSNPRNASIYSINSEHNVMLE